MFIQALTAFNLVCSITVTSDPARPTREVVYRIDLGADRYCADECSQTSKIVSKSATQIVLEEYFLPNESARTVVNRESGKYSSIWNAKVSGKPVSVAMSGQCEVASFSGGFPKQRF